MTRHGNAIFVKMSQWFMQTLFYEHVHHCHIVLNTYSYKSVWFKFPGIATEFNYPLGGVYVHPQYLQERFRHYSNVTA